VRAAKSVFGKPCNAFLLVVVLVIGFQGLLECEDDDEYESSAT